MTDNNQNATDHVGRAGMILLPLLVTIGQSGVILITMSHQIEVREGAKHPDYVL